MPTIYLHEFIETGLFGEIRFGWTRSQLEAELGPAETHENTEKDNEFPIAWVYGDIEFFFDSYESDGRLCTIFFDYFDVPNGWGDLVIDPWEISAKLSFSKAQVLFEKNGINYKHQKSINSGGAILATESGVKCEFVIERQDEFAPPVGLVAISAQKLKN